MPRSPAALSFLLLCILLVMPTACKRRERTSVTQEPFVGSMISAGDPRAAVQFRKGFYAIEANAWRWTGKQFEVALSPPAHASEKGAQLVLHFALPDIVIQNLHSVALSASIGDLNLEPQTYDKAGPGTYTRDVPPGKMGGEMILVDFHLDKAIPPSGADARELGMIVSQVGFVAK